MEINKKFDSWYEKVKGYVTKKVSTFVAFIFLLIALGVVVGIQATHYFSGAAWGIVIIPAGIGIIAYYNRAFATILFMIMMLFVFFL